MLKPKRWIPILCLAGALTALGATPPNLMQAVEAQRALAQERPFDSAVLNDLGNLLTLSGELGEAEAAYRRAIEAEPDKATAHFNLALLLHRIGDRAGALAELDRVVEILPDNAWAHYQRGVLLQAAGRRQQAVEAYARALSLDPGLGFSEVNPHVIENSLLTEAMLVAHRGSAYEPQAPYAYADPGRIAGLLVPRPAAKAPMEMEEEDAPGVEAAQVEPAAEGRPPGAGRRGKAGDQEPGGGSQLVPRKVITEEDLEPGSVVGQATPPQAGAGYSRGRTSSRSWPTSVLVGGQRTTRTDPSGRSATPGGSSAVRPPGAPGSSSSSSSSRYRPPVRSTGRLELDVRPSAGPDESVAPAG